MCQSRADSDLPGITFQAVARARKQLMLTELAGRGLGDLGNPVLLFLLKEREGQVSSQKELSDAMRISPASVAVSLKSLERGGYVEKLSDEKDQRRKAVRLTDKGRAALPWRRWSRSEPSSCGCSATYEILCLRKGWTVHAEKTLSLYGGV